MPQPKKVKKVKKLGLSAKPMDGYTLLNARQDTMRMLLGTSGYGDKTPPSEQQMTDAARAAVRIVNELMG